MSNSERRGMVPEKLINEFVERVRAAAGTNLLAAILYGSAAAGDYIADYSDVNLLRQRLLLVSGNAEAKWELLLRSLPAFGTMFRHALIALDDAGAGSGSKREVAAAVAAKLGIDANVFGELLDIRERKKDRKAAKVDELFARYLRLVEQVTAAVDKMLDPAA